MDRRGFLKGMAGILAAGVAPAVLPSGIIMPIRELVVPSTACDLYNLQLEHATINSELWTVLAWVRVAGGEWELRTATVHCPMSPRVGIRPTGEIIALDGTIQSRTSSPLAFSLGGKMERKYTVSGRSDGYVALTGRGVHIPEGIALSMPINGQSQSWDFSEGLTTHTPSGNQN